MADARHARCTDPRLLTSFDRLQSLPAHEAKVRSSSPRLASSRSARPNARVWRQATIKALTQHVSLVDHVAHEQLLLKVRPRHARSPPQAYACLALQLFAPSLWDFAPDVAEAVTVFAVTLVRPCPCRHQHTGATLTGFLRSPRILRACTGALTCS